jgi:hypothetical protein
MRLTREDLHLRVWERPMAAVAQELGLTVARLQRICVSLDVPFPWSGFWRDGAPLDGEARRLPQARAGRPQAVTIDDPPPDAGEALAGGTTAAPPRSRRGTPPKPIDPEKILTEVPAADLHPIIAARLEAERREGDTEAQPTPDAPARLNRYGLIRNRLLLALERAGHGVRTDGQSLYAVHFEVFGQSVTHRMRERYTRTRRPLTAKEAREPLNVALGRTHAFEERMTGQLVLAIQTHRYGQKAEWRDDRRGRLETRIAEMVAGIEAAVRDAERIDAERADREARWLRREARRAEAERRAQDEEDRWVRLCQLAAWHERAMRVAALLGRVRKTAAKAIAADPALAAWFDWAEAERLDRDPAAWALTSIVRHVDAPPDEDDDEDWDDGVDDDDEEDEEDADREPPI